MTRPVIGREEQLPDIHCPACGMTKDENWWEWAGRLKVGDDYDCQQCGVKLEVEDLYFPAPYVTWRIYEARSRPDCKPLGRCECADEACQHCLGKCEAEATVAMVHGQRKEYETAMGQCLLCDGCALDEAKRWSEEET
jgi:hypothetical protein